MEALLYFLVWGVIVFLMMRFGCGAHIAGRGQGQTRNEPGEGGDPALRWMPPAKDADPVCGRTVTTDNAKPSVHAGHVYYFCSRECREVFEAAPDLYVGGGEANQTELEHSHV